MEIYVPALASGVLETGLCTTVGIAHLNNLPDIGGGVGQVRLGLDDGQVGGAGDEPVCELDDSRLFPF